MARSPTWAEVTRAKRTGAANAFVMCAFILKDKCDFDNDELCDFMVNIKKLSEEIKEGRVNIADLSGVLKEEYGIDFGG